MAKRPAADPLHRCRAHRVVGPARYSGAGAGRDRHRAVLVAGSLDPEPLHLPAHTRPGRSSWPSPHAPGRVAVLRGDSSCPVDTASAGGSQASSVSRRSRQGFALSPSMAFFGGEYQSVGLLSLLLAGGVFFLLTQLLTSLGRIRALSWSTVVGGVVVALVTILQVRDMDPLGLSRENLYVLQRGPSLLGNPDFTATYLVVPVLVAAALASVCRVYAARRRSRGPLRVHASGRRDIADAWCVGRRRCRRRGARRGCQALEPPGAARGAGCWAAWGSCWPHRCCTGGRQASWRDSPTWPAPPPPETGASSCGRTLWPWRRSTRCSVRGPIRTAWGGTPCARSRRFASPASR